MRRSTRPTSTSTCPPSLALAGDAGLTLDALIAELRDIIGTARRGRRQAVEAEIKSVNDAWLAEWRGKLTSDECR